MLVEEFPDVFGFVRQHTTPSVYATTQEESEDREAGLDETRPPSAVVLTPEQFKVSVTVAAVSWLHSGNCKRNRP